MPAIRQPLKSTLIDSPAELHRELAFPNKKELVFVVMMMPDELALELHEFDRNRSARRRSFRRRRTAVVKETELLHQIDLAEHLASLLPPFGSIILNQSRCR